MIKQERNKSHCLHPPLQPTRDESKPGRLRHEKMAVFCWGLQGPGRRLPTSDSGVDMSVSPHSRSLPTPHVASPHQMQQPPRHPDAYAEDDPNLYRGEIDGLMKQQNYQRQRPIYPVSEWDRVLAIGSAWIERDDDVRRSKEGKREQLGEIKHSTSYAQPCTSCERVGADR